LAEYFGLLWAFFLTLSDHVEKVAKASKVPLKESESIDRNMLVRWKVAEDDFEESEAVKT
jgi:hypothetical protein